MQEQFLIKVKRIGYQGIGFTCGGFIHQTSKNEIDYYPAWIDKINLRFIYRMYKEKHTRKEGKIMKKLCTSLLAILTLCTMANAPIYANNEESTPETLEIAIPADQWAGTSETFELDNGDIVEITISKLKASFICLKIS